MSSFASSDQNIKKPNVSGQFYEADPKRLSSHIDHLFTKAENTPYKDHLELIIAPHAGYVYSGGVAAHSFKAVSKHQYNTIVVLAPSHFVAFDGVAVWEEGGFETPLGIVDVDHAFTKKLLDSGEKVWFHREAFEKEHSLEVEIPFLQKTFSNFKIVPVVIGQPDFETLEAFAQTLHRVVGSRKDVLIVVSTDLSHYHDGAFAKQMDARTIQAIESLDIAALIRGNQDKTMEMCGFFPVITSLIYAKEKGLKSVDVLKYAHSGDVTGDHSRVVGYTAIAFRASKDSKVQELTLEQKKRLYDIAKQTITEYVQSGKKLDFKEGDERLAIEEGAFVTVRKKGQLRGCIGNVLGKGPLHQTVRDMAVAAVSQDPRFNPVSKEELIELEIEVSVLSKPWRIESVDEIELGVHGVIISQGFKSGLFLPEVATDFGFSKEEFLSRLASEKAGLAADAWKDPKTKIEIFTTTKFTAQDLK